MSYLHRPLGAIRSVVVPVSAAQCHTLNSSPLTAIPAPGVGFMIFPYRLRGIHVPGSHFYGQRVGDWQLMWGPNNIPNPMDTNSGSGGYGLGLRQITSWDYWKESGTNTLVVGTQVDNQPIKIQCGDMIAGELLTGHVVAGGSGYAVNDTGIIGSGIDDPATYIVTAVGGGGSVTSVNITYPGCATVGIGQSGYIVGDTGLDLAPGGAQPGGGDGAATFTVDTVTLGNGTFVIYIEYAILPTT